MVDSVFSALTGGTVSKKVLNGFAWVLRGGVGAGSGTALKNAAISTIRMPKDSVHICWPSLYTLAGRSHNFIRLAGLSGAAAVILGAIGSHRLSPTVDAESRTIFETANRFHFFHSLALFGMPLAKYPALSGALMISGSVMFSGLLYYRAFTGDKTYAKLAPVGGTCLILAWLSLML